MLMAVGGVISTFGSNYEAATAGFFGFVPSGVLLAVFTWTVKDGRWPSFPRLIIAALPAVFMMALMSYAVATAPPPPPPPPTVAEMLEDHTLLDCEILRPAAEEARYEMTGAQFGGVTVDELKYYGKVHGLYWQNCS